MRRLAVVLALVLAAPLARADEYDAAMARAAAMKEKAIDSGDPASWLETYRLFEEADAIRATKESKYELAAAAARTKSDDIAYQAYEDAIALGLEGPAREKADAFLAEHAGALARIVVTGPAGADIVVGTRKRGKLPLPKPLVAFAGIVRVTITHEGRTTEKAVTAAAGTTVTVDFSAPPPPPPPPPAAPPAPAVVDTSGRSAGLTLVGVGGATAAVGIVSWIVAQRTIDLTRRSLDETCAVRAGDRCTETWPEYVTYAKSDVDRIASWKAVRVGSIVTTAVGAVLVSAGLVRLATYTPRVNVGSSSLVLSFEGRF